MNLRYQDVGKIIIKSVLNYFCIFLLYTLDDKEKFISITETVSINKPNMEEEKQSDQTENRNEALASKGDYT